MADSSSKPTQAPRPHTDADVAPDTDADPPADRKTTGRKNTHPQTDETIKETLESFIMAFVLAFVFRAYVVEAFVIPTGSMAPTLLGQHYALICEQCGYNFTADDGKGNGAVRQVLDPRTGKPVVVEAQVACPMCHFPATITYDMATRPGDRILVHKFLYSLSEPGRWDVVVFKNPDMPTQSYIKRLVGLPNEALWIADGNIYTRPLDLPDAPWQIASKMDRLDVQRAVWQPISHSQYVPLDGGEPSLAREDWNNDLHTWAVPWTPARPDDAWEIENQPSFHYAGSEPSRIEFDMLQAMGGTQPHYPYNYYDSPTGFEPIEDVRIAATFLPDAPGLGVQLQTTARLDQHDLQHQRSFIAAAIDPTGRCAILTSPDGETFVPVVTGQVDPLEPGEPTDVEFWFVDQQATLFVEGDIAAAWSFSLPMDVIHSRPTLADMPQISIEVTGSPVTLHRVEVDRDLYYSERKAGQHRERARGGYAKGPFARRTENAPALIGPDRFFFIGDNTAHSHDSRYWTTLDDDVRRLLFTEDEEPVGMVPRNLLMGRAFFVYFPAPYALKPESGGLIPNFTDMRLIH